MNLQDNVNNLLEYVNAGEARHAKKSDDSINTINDSDGNRINSTYLKIDGSNTQKAVPVNITGTAERAVADQNGNNISNTYLKKTEKAIAANVADSFVQNVVLDITGDDARGTVSFRTNGYYPLKLSVNHAKKANYISNGFSPIYQVFDMNMSIYYGGFFKIAKIKAVNPLDFRANLRYFGTGLRTTVKGDISFSFYDEADFFDTRACGNDVNAQFYIKEINQKEYELYIKSDIRHFYFEFLSDQGGNTTIEFEPQKAEKDNAMKLIRQDVPLPVHSAYSHNGIYRGNDITEYFKSGQMSAHIKDRTYSGIYIGDQIKMDMTIDNQTFESRWTVADLDYFYENGVLLVSDCYFANKKYHMASSPSTDGGYVNSDMWKNTIPLYAKAVKNAFGADHVVDHLEFLTSSIDKNAQSLVYNRKGASLWTFQKTVTVNLLNESMLFGTSMLGFPLYESYGAPCQLSLFRLNRDSIASSNNGGYWLRTIASDREYCSEYYPKNSGNVDPVNANDERYIRLYFILK